MMRCETLCGSEIMILGFYLLSGALYGRKSRLGLLGSLASRRVTVLSQVWLSSVCAWNRRAASAASLVVSVATVPDNMTANAVSLCS